jgi:hypothetical protein
VVATLTEDQKVLALTIETPEPNSPESISVDTVHSHAKMMIQECILLHYHFPLIVLIPLPFPSGRPVPIAPVMAIEGDEKGYELLYGSI